MEKIIPDYVSSCLHQWIKEKYKNIKQESILIVFYDNIILFSESFIKFLILLERVLKPKTAAVFSREHQQACNLV